MERRESVNINKANPYSNPGGVRESKPAQLGKFKEPATIEKIDQILAAIELCEQGNDRFKKPMSEQMKVITLKSRIQQLKEFDAHAHENGFNIPNDAFIHQVLGNYASL